MPAIFISYRREDSAGYAGRLHEELEERLGREQVFRDVDTLRAGEDFEAAIRRRLSQCQACVVMIGPGWLKSQTADGRRRLQQADDYVAMEIAAALARPEVMVVPVLVGGATMPSPADLPEALVPQARRHALTVRDETWEADMDRLATALPAAASRRAANNAVPAATRGGLPRYVVPTALVVLALVAGTAYLLRGDSASTVTTPDTTANPGGLAEGPAYAIDVPSTGEVGHGDFVYTVVSGSVQRRGQGLRVWLRVRASNEGFNSINFWDDAFRLLVGNQTIAPSGGLNEILEHRSIRQGVIRFDVPDAPAKATLRISYLGKSGDLPLDLSSNGSAPRHDQQDERDALSHAVLSSVVRDETPLVMTADASTTAMRISRRAFTNVQRITVVVKWTNSSRYPMATSDLTLRLVAGADLLAPFKTPSEVVAPESTYVGDIVFEVPPTVKTASLISSLRHVKSEMPLRLH